MPNARATEADTRPQELPRRPLPPEFPLALLTHSGQGGDRTPDTRIFSPVLYQLSYLSSCDAEATA